MEKKLPVLTFKHNGALRFRQFDNYIYIGNYSIASRLINKQRKMAELRKDKNVLQANKMNECEMYIDMGRVEQANHILQDIKSEVKEYETTIPEKIELNLIQAKIAVLESEYNAAIRLTSQLLPVIKKVKEYSYLSEIKLFRGQALTASGNVNEGLSYLKECIQIAREQEVPYGIAKGSLALAEAMFEHHDFSDDAVSALDEAETIFARLGAQHQLKKVEELRAKYIDGREKEEKSPNQYLEGLREVSEVIKNKLGDEDFLSKLLSITLDLTGAERGMVFVVEGDDLYPVASERIDSATATDALRISSTIVHQMRYEQQPIYTMDAMKDRRFNRSQSILINKIRSFICVPLMVADNILGTIYLDSTRAGIFKPDNLLYFETLGNLLATSIDKSAEFKKMQKRLALVRQRKDLGKTGIVIGSSPAMKKLYKQLDQIAKSDANVLLEGETGSGKGVFARMIHEQSTRSKQDFCCINCGILPENIFETELFGAKKGAYTGANADRKGLLEAADCSTVFFDEITNTSPALQAKLLEVIEEKIIRRMGDTKTRKVNLRFIFATNRDLEQEVRESRFREDLLFRINTITLKVPALRKRREDMSEFAGFFLKKFSREFGKDVTAIDKDALKRLVGYSWPGNIRELRNVMERLVLLAEGKKITKDLLEEHFSPLVAHVPKKKPETLKLSEPELKELIQRTLSEVRGNVTEAAKRLNISRRHLYRLRKKYNIYPE
jgi:transcriptional regulator with GAF, ATPase, and Fis domain